jgi:hypothetical protein
LKISLRKSFSNVLPLLMVSLSLCQSPALSPADL